MFCPFQALRSALGALRSQAQVHDAAIRQLHEFLRRMMPRYLPSPGAKRTRLALEAPGVCLDSGDERSSPAHVHSLGPRGRALSKSLVRT
jgi:hypothetical protein